MTQTDDVLKEAFVLFDQDKDGYISADELMTVMKSLGVFQTREEVRALISEGTTGQFTAREGRIDYEFFCHLMRKRAKVDDMESELKDAFRVLDSTGQGFIGTAEMRSICKELGVDMEEHEVHDMIAEAISNYDGKVYYDGFVKCLIAKM